MEHEKAIIDYCKTQDQRERTKLYEEFIGPVFDEMVDKIVYTFKFTVLPNISELRAECKVWLITVLGKYDPDKGSKAFSYFSVITKNWFIHKVKRNTHTSATEVEIGDMTKDTELKFASIETPYFKDRDTLEFLGTLKSSFDQWEKQNSYSENDEKVLKAVRMLFESSNDIEIFNKKAIYLYLREITGLNTKQVVSSLKKIRRNYKIFKRGWENQGI